MMMVMMMEGGVLGWKQVEGTKEWLESRMKYLENAWDCSGKQHRSRTCSVSTSGSRCDETKEEVPVCRNAEVMLPYLP